MRSKRRALAHAGGMRGWDAGADWPRGSGNGLMWIAQIAKLTQAAHVHNVTRFHVYDDHVAHVPRGIIAGGCPRRTRLECMRFLVARSSPGRRPVVHLLCAKPSGEQCV